MHLYGLIRKLSSPVESSEASGFAQLRMSSTMQFSLQKISLVRFKDSRYDTEPFHEGASCWDQHTQQGLGQDRGSHGDGKDEWKGVNQFPSLPTFSTDCSRQTVRNSKRERERERERQRKENEGGRYMDRKIDRYADRWTDKQR